MPNHCENDLYISGPKEEVAALLALIGADREPYNFDFCAVLPYPEHFRVRDEDARAWEKEHGWQKARQMLLAKYGGEADGYNSGGYDWCIQAWGTKWSAYKVQRRDWGDVCVSFRTAWSPPMPVIAALHTRFPTLTLSLEFFERGCAVSGGVTFCSEDDHYGDEPWQAGTPSRAWEGKYLGQRGG